MARLPPRKATQEERDKGDKRNTQRDDGAEEALPEDEIPVAESAGDAAVPEPADLEGELNTSLMDVLDLLGREVARLQEALDFYRMSEVADKEAIIRWHVREIDARHDRMAEVKSMILASDDDKLH